MVFFEILIIVFCIIVFCIIVFCISIICNNIKYDDTKFVSCNYVGGLGNQLFGIYTAISYGIDNNKIPIFKHKNTTGNRPTYWNSIFKNLNIRDTDLIKWENVNENSLGTYEINDKIKDKNIMFNGYLQSKNNFIKNLQKINIILGIEELKLQIKNKYINLFDNAEIIAVHFRLGDYKNLQEVHNLLSDDYYINSLEDIGIKNKKILVFCEKEDINTVENRMKNILKDNTKEFTIVSNNEIDDMFLISLCNYIITANSTFSFWGSVFSNHKNIYLPVYNWFDNTEDRLLLEG